MPASMEYKHDATWIEINYIRTPISVSEFQSSSVGLVSIIMA
jgi:hypothetical protein